MNRKTILKGIVVTLVFGLLISAFSFYLWPGCSATLNCPTGETVYCEAFGICTTSYCYSKDTWVYCECDEDTRIYVFCGPQGGPRVPVG